MSTLFLLAAVLCSGSVLSQVQVPCYGEGCNNITVYLGPRQGSRVIMLPRSKTTARPQEITGSRYDHDEARRERRPQHRPVPPGGEIRVDFMDDESPSTKPAPTQSPFQTTRSSYEGNNIWSMWDPSTTRRPSLYRTGPTGHPNREVQVVDRGTVDLTWRGYTGEEVKEVLMSLPEADRARVATLVLDRNRIRLLPVLAFPVEFEYGLQELSLADNPFSPPYLTSYTRFELSRLAHLKKLNMTRCGLRSIDMPNLPSLEVLDLSYNGLFSLPYSLDRLGNLLQLFLRGNRITYISNFPLSSLTNLWVLDLGHNSLRELNGEPLEKLRSLVTIKLDNNRLNSLPLLDVERSKFVSLANNSLQCSCALLRWIDFGNRQVQDDYFERCYDGERTIRLQELRTWPEGHQNLCDSGWWGERAWSAAALWFRRNVDIVRVMYKVVGVVIVVAAVALLLKNRKKLAAKAKPRGIPYNVLDDQKVSTVSGPHVDV